MHALRLTLAALVGLIAAAASAQTDSPAAALRITVVDQSGAVIVGAAVTVEPPDSALPIETVTDARGEALVDRLLPGRYRVSIAATGFERRTLADLRLARGETRRQVRLALATIKESVTVTSVDRLRSGFVTVLTPAQIDDLPDDPDEMEQVLKDMAGPGSPTIRVDGFTGISLPRKSEIQSIRFRRDEFAAEHHARGAVVIDITTKAGLGPLRGSVASTVRNGALDARNAFVPDRPQDGRQQYDLQFDGPLWRNHTSFSAKVTRSAAYTAKPIAAALVTGPLYQQIRQPADLLSTSFRMKQSLPASHIAGFYLEQGHSSLDDLGVGGFSLAERGYSSSGRSSAFGVVESGPLGRHLFTQFRIQQRTSDTIMTPLNHSAAVIVLDAFQAGGAQISGSRATQTLAVEENVDVFTGGAHALRAGVLFERTSVDSDVARNADGTFTFAGLADFSAGRPTTFVRRLGDPRVALAQSRLGWYVQDDIRVRPSLLVAAGLRQERESGVDGWLNASPRFGLTWAPAPTTTLYAGGGVFHDWLEVDTLEQTVRVDGERQWDEVVLAPGYPDPSAAGTARVLPRSRFMLAPGLQLPSIVRFSARLQHRPMNGMLVTARYAEEHGSSLFRGQNINAPLADGSRPDRLFGNVVQVESTGRSQLRSLLVGLTAATARRSSVTFNYELARAYDEADDPFSLPADSRSPSAEWGPARTDVRHHLMAYFHANIGSELRFDTRLTASSSLPYTITTGRDDNADGVVNDRPSDIGRNTGRGAWQRTVGTRLTWRRGFGPPASGVSSVSGIPGGEVTVVAGPPGTMRRFTIVLYADAQNVFNQVSYVNYSGVLTSPFFGRPTAALPGRQLLLGAQFVF